MNYELAKELKEAGFPEPKDWENKYAYCLGNLKDFEHQFCNSTLQLIHNDSDECGLVGDSSSHLFDENKWLYVPTLEELIEACGEIPLMIHSTMFDHDKNGPSETWIWYAGDIMEIHKGKGATPTEAVARLWIALHTKS